MTYGDGDSYSLPVLALLYDAIIMAGAPVSTGETADPGQVSPFTGDAEVTRDVRLTSLMDLTGGDAPVFFFNNNQTNSGGAENQNLAVWAALTLYDDQGTLDPLTFYYTNLGGKYALISEGGGVLNGTAGTGTLGTPTGPLAGDNTSTDYVLAGGQLCYNTTPPFSGAVPCDSANASAPVNHSWGANQVVYAVVLPALNDILLAGGAYSYDTTSAPMTY